MDWAVSEAVWWASREDPERSSFQDFLRSAEAGITMTNTEMNREVTCSAIGAVDWSVHSVVHRAACDAVNEDMETDVRRALSDAAPWAVGRAVIDAVNDPSHPALQDSLRSCGAEVEV